MAEYMESIISILEKIVQNKEYLKSFSTLVIRINFLKILKKLLLIKIFRFLNLYYHRL
jgi:hypothetical protein